MGRVQSKVGGEHTNKEANIKINTKIGICTEFFGSKRRKSNFQ